MVKPMLDELLRREKENRKMHQDITLRQLNIKILFSMIRSPKLCDLMYKAERKQYEKDKLDKIHEQCVLTLR